MASSAPASKQTAGRKVARRRKNLHVNAGAVILAHNHPSGSAVPSDGDKQLTHVLASTLALVDVKVLDHLVVTGDAVASMAECGLLDFASRAVA